MQGGLPWWAQLAGAISRAHCLILMMTPAAMASPSVDDEYSYAWRQGVHGCPRKATSDDVLKALFLQLPRWIKRCHFHAIQAEWGRFVADLKAPPREARVVFVAPPQAEGYVVRKAEFQNLKDYPLAEEGQTRVAISTAVQGGGGLGKTTLGRALCHNPQVRERFDDGILWVELGQEPTVASEMAGHYHILMLRWIRRAWTSHPMQLSAPAP